MTAGLVSKSAWIVAGNNPSNGTFNERRHRQQASVASKSVTKPLAPSFSGGTISQAAGAGVSLSATARRHWHHTISSATVPNNDQFIVSKRQWNHDDQRGADISTNS
jgi:hypothetical protein